MHREAQNGCGLDPLALLCMLARPVCAWCNVLSHIFIATHLPA